jgi:hypothetical protein
MKGLEGTLASLGTLQSSAMGNLGARINEGAQRQDYQAQRALTDRKGDIQDQVRMAENEAEGLIQQEANRFQQQMAQLSGAMDENSIEYKQAASALQDQADQRINKILDSLDEFSYNVQLENIKAQSGAEEQLSDHFLQTGEPISRADLLWMRENPDYMERIESKGQESEQALQGLGLIQEIKTSNLEPVTGTFKIGSRIPGSTAYDTRQKIEQVKSILELAAAGQLKGQGQISEGEREILQQAASGLDYGKSTDEFVKSLNDAERVLETIIFGGSDNSPRFNYGNDTDQTDQIILQQYGG